MRKRWIAPLLIAAMWAFALAVYPRLPDRIPIHWDLKGEVNGWGGPGSAFLFPAIAARDLIRHRHRELRVDRGHDAELSAGGPTARDDGIDRHGPIL